MNRNLILLVLTFFLVKGLSQNPGNDFRLRFSPTIKKEKLNFVRNIYEIVPELGTKLSLPYKERYKLNQLLDQQRIVYGNQSAFIKLVDFISLEITATCTGKTLSASSANEMLTTEQRNILNAADLGTDINLKIELKYKNNVADLNGMEHGILIGTIAVTVVPDSEAEFPGGMAPFSNYIYENVIYKIGGLDASQKILQAIVKFTVNELGEILDVKISRTSNDPGIDALLLSAINNMPKWKPALNANGVKVKQEFNIPFGGGGC